MYNYETNDTSSMPAHVMPRGAGDGSCIMKSESARLLIPGCGVCATRDSVQSTIHRMSTTRTSCSWCSIPPVEEGTRMYIGYTHRCTACRAAEHRWSCYPGYQISRVLDPTSTRWWISATPGSVVCIITRNTCIMDARCCIGVVQYIGAYAVPRYTQ